jgi:predicted MPP superfamily phosphohydrolase
VATGSAASTCASTSATRRLLSSGGLGFVSSWWGRGSWSLGSGRVFRNVYNAENDYGVQMMILRRTLTAILVAAIAGCLVWGFWLEPASLRTEVVELPLAWPYSRPIRVALASDLHVGSPYESVAHLRTVVDRINATNPDLVCLLGDFVTVDLFGGNVAPEELTTELSRLRAPAGVAAVLGNHDHARGLRRMYEALSRAGIRVLEDTAIRVVTPSGPVWIAGVSDFRKGSHDVRRALGGIPNGDTPIVVITHNPDIFPEVPKGVLLTLAGHTHGGQVRLPLIGSPIVPSRFGQRYVMGHIQEHGRDLFVTTGVGTSGIPIRFGVPPVISILEISRAADSGRSGGSNR